MILNELAVSDDHALDLLMALADGMVQANILTIELSPDSYPCCAGCGEFRLDRYAVSSPRRAVATMTVKDVQQLRASSHGTAYELAAFQCAQRRREGEDNAWVRVSHDAETRELVCVVVRPDKGNDEEEDMRKYAPTRNCGGEEACDCGGG